MDDNIIAVISDIHGNYEALEVVLLKITAMGITKIICLGDVIGYGVDGELCLKRLSELDCKILMGNHEAIFLGKISSDCCSNLGKLSAIWQKKNLNLNTTLDDLPISYRYRDLTFAHSTLNEYGYCTYLNNVEDILDSFKKIGPVVFYGHTHRPRITTIRGSEISDMLIKRDTTIEIKHNDRCYINVGSVGQQRDNKTDASFATCHIKRSGFEIKIHRIGYQSYRTYRKIFKYPELQPIAKYLIREQWRRDFYELLNNGRYRIYRKTPDR